MSQKFQYTDMHPSQIRKYIANKNVKLGQNQMFACVFIYFYITVL